MCFVKFPLCTFLARFARMYPMPYVPSLPSTHSVVFYMFLLLYLPYWHYLPYVPMCVLCLMCLICPLCMVCYRFSCLDLFALFGLFGFCGSAPYLPYLHYKPAFVVIFVFKSFPRGASNTRDGGQTAFKGQGEATPTDGKPRVHGQFVTNDTGWQPSSMDNKLRSTRVHVGFIGHDPTNRTVRLNEYARPHTEHRTLHVPVQGGNEA